MRESSIFEAVNIVFNGAGVNFTFNGTFLKSFRIMDSLGTTEDLLASHEVIVRASITWVIFTKGCVEWTSCCWISVEHVEIGIVFVSD